MELFNETIEKEKFLIEITIFQDYGDQLKRYGIPPIFKGFWVYFTIEDNEGKKIAGFPLIDQNHKLIVFEKHQEAIEAAREKANEM